MKRKQSKTSLEGTNEERSHLPPGVKLVRTLKGHTEHIGRIGWSPDGRMLASPSEDGTIRLWDTKTGKCLKILEGHERRVYAAGFHPAGQTLASAGGEGTVKIWEAGSGKLLSSLDYGGPVGYVTYDPTGRVLAGAGSGPVTIWLATTAEEHPNIVGAQFKYESSRSRLVSLL
jgi:WD40 repeat protein